MTRAHRLRLRAVALRESAERDTKRAEYWARLGDEAEARAKRAYGAAEALDTEADRITASGLPFPLMLIGA